VDFETNGIGPPDWIKPKGFWCCSGEAMRPTETAALQNTERLSRYLHKKKKSGDGLSLSALEVKVYRLAMNAKILDKIEAYFIYDYVDLNIEDINGTLKRIDVVIAAWEYYGFYMPLPAPYDETELHRLLIAPDERRNVA
jgi:hypothetical protein